MSRFHSTKKSFGYAINGLKTAFKNEPNMQTHVFIGSLALLAGAFLGLTLSEWTLLMFVIFFVIVLELFNTSLENIVDLVSPNIDAKAKVAKDVSAAAVLCAAALSVIVGFMLFLPKIIELLR